MTQNQINTRQILFNEIKFLLSMNSISINEAVKKLVNEGIDDKVAKQLVTKWIKENNAEVLKDKLNEEYQQDEMWGEILITLIISAIASVSIPVYFVVFIIAILFGTYRYKKTKNSKIVGYVTFVLFFPFILSFYLSLRSEIYKIELIIPVIVAFAPSYIFTLIFENFIQKSE
jgi:hypothetical protein